MRSVPSTAVPSDAVSRPDAMRSSVLLPHPDGPTTVTNSPRFTTRSTPCSAMVPSGKVISTFVKSSSTSVVGACAVDGAGAVTVITASPRFQERRLVQEGGLGDVVRHRALGNQVAGVNHITI